MTAQPIEANVVLTSDNSQYDRAMDTSAGGTDRLGASVDQLGRKINNLSKIAGKTLIGISAADVAVITGATAAWSSYEKQMSRLQAQSAILTRTNTQQSAVMKDYTMAVKGLRTEFGTTTSEAAKLVETLSKVTNIRQSRDLSDLSKVFVEMSHATGESSEGLANSLTNLQRVMGTPINSKNTRTYADQFTYLAAQTQTSASGLADFTAQLAPTAKAMGMTNNQVAGFATAFAKAGQDSGAAATVFAKITTDISHSMQTGSPEIAHYANLLGVTQKAFKEMGAGEQVIEIFEKLQSQGKGAATELNRLGLDGPRSIRAIQAMIASGGLREAMGLADTGAKSGAAAEGAAASTRGMSDDLAKLNQNFQQLAETMGGYFGPILEHFVQGMNLALEVTNKIAEGPLGLFVSMIMEVVAPLATGAGLLLLFAGALMKVAAAFTLFRSSGMMGVREGIRGGGPLGTAGVGPTGERLEAAGTGFQRFQYRGGQAVGSLVGSALGSVRSGWQTGRGLVDSNYTPGPPRSMLSYMAGGIGRGIDTFLTPGFDQMRYADPTMRERSRFFQRSPMGMSAAVRDAAATADESRTRARQAGAVYQSTQAAYGSADPATEQAKREMHRANQEALAATRTSVTAQKEQVETIKSLNRESRNTSEGFSRLTRAAGGFAVGAGGGILGAGRAGAGMLMRSPMGMPIAGMGATAALSGFGVQSNTAMLGAMGLMMGPEGAAVGAGVGAVLDTVQANNKMSDSVKDLKASADEASKTGGGLSALNDSLDSTGKTITDTAKSFDQSSWGYWFGKPGSIGQLAGGTKNTIEGMFGKSDVEEARSGEEAQRARILQMEGSARDVARQTGTKITGTRRNQLSQLDTLMSGTGAERLAAAGIDPQDLVDARTAMIRGDEGANDTYQKMLAKISAPSAAAGRRADTTAAGQAMTDSASAQQSIRHQEDVKLFYSATSDIFSRLHKQGMGDLQIMESTEKAQRRIGDQNDRQYELQMAVSAKAQQNLQMQMPLMSRAQGFQAQIGQMNALSAITPVTQEQAAQLDQQKQATAQAFVDQASYFKQMLLMQDQYEIQRNRAQQDYSLQRSYQEHDFQLQRTRAEYQFHLSQNRATDDYYRGVRRAHYDFNLQRGRAEDDYQHSVAIQAKQMAMNVYDIYQRVQVQRTSSASQILGNAADQLSRMREQERDLDRLRGMGASDAMIQQMKFNDPANQQQLARFLSEATPRIVRQFNSVAGSLRENAAAQIANDPSSLDADERRRQHRLQLQRSREDFQRQMELGHDDFTRALGRQRKDFNLMMDNQATDFDTQMGRQADAYALSMQRSAEDLANVGKEIDGNFESILVQASKRLTGHARQQALDVLGSFRDLKGSTSAEAIATMQDLAEIFGFKYKVPKGVSNNQPSGNRGTDDMSLHGFGGHTTPGTGMAGGGVVPGWSPGRDTQMVPLSGGEAIMRPEWARAMGEGYINAANHAAKHGGFADGGLVNPDARVYMDGEPVSKITKAQILLAEHLSHIDFRTMQGSWQPYTAYSGSSHMGPGVVDESPGNFRTQYWLRRVGFAAWGRNFPGAASAGSGAHVHAVSLLDPGAAHQSQIAAYYAGQDGLGGSDYGPDPGMIPGLRGMLPQYAALASIRDAHESGAAATPRLASILKHRYPHSEKAAAAMSGVHPLFPGDISHVMNQLVRKRYAESLEGIDPNQHHSWYGQGGVFGSPRTIGVGEAGPEAVIPLNDQGANFLAMAIHGAEARGIGMGSAPMRGGMSVYNTRIDKSTNFTGPITVQANDPNELISRLQARQRVMALSRPSLTGSAA